MPEGAGVYVYDGKRGRVYRVKSIDADGRHVMETLGRESDGWTRRKAEAELHERLVRVERRGWHKPAPSPSPPTPTRGSRRASGVAAGSRGQWASTRLC